MSRLSCQTWRMAKAYRSGFLRWSCVAQWGRSILSMSHIVSPEEQQHHKITTYTAIDVDTEETASESVDISTPSQWPKTPQPLRKSGWSLFADLALLLLPIAFLGLLTASINKTRHSSCCSVSSDSFYLP